MTSPTPAAPAFEKRVQQYVAIRDRIKEIKEKHTAELKGFTDTLEKLNGLMLAHLNQVGGNGVMTDYGTVSKTTKKSASIADKSAFWTFVVAMGDFGFIDYKANVTRVEEYINNKDDNPDGHLPPGVNWSQVDLVNVKRKSGT